MIGPLVIGAIIWFLLVATVAYIEWLEKYNGYIVLFITMAILMESIYTSFFAPPRKAIFTENEVILEKSNVFLAYAYPSSSRVEIKHDLIDKFEFDFYKSKDLYFDALFLQIFIVVDGKRYLIGENQISSNHSSYIPSEEQKKEGQKYVDILTKLIGR
ncbi:MAG TPA: hypothetical protein DGG95_05885 [Cytophagales bacterium]|nr:hypothetical protein [Cytophagales bacterium]